MVYFVSLAPANPFIFTNKYLANWREVTERRTLLLTYCHWHKNQEHWPVLLKRERQVDKAMDIYTFSLQ